MADYGLLGNPLGHSISPEIHSEFGYEYELFDTPPDKIGEFLKKNLLGFNVTIPYKKVIMDYLDEVDCTAYEIGAVNTVVRCGDRLFGYNTDILGMHYALKNSGIDLKDKSVMILGSGGTSSTAQVLAKKCGAKKNYRRVEVRGDKLYQLHRLHRHRNYHKYHTSRNVPEYR